MPEKKPEWVIKKERQKKVEAAHTYWLFGIHAVRDALENPGREKIKLLVTENTLQKLEVSINKIDI